MSIYASIAANKRPDRSIMSAGAIRREQYHALLLHPVHHYFQRTAEAHVAYVLRLVNGGHGVEQFLLEYAVVLVSVDGEISHAETRQVLEEVRALARVNAIVWQSGLNYHARRADVRPLHGNAQPIVA